MSESATLLIPGRVGDLGGGFKVARLLPYRRRRMVGPFIFFDHMGPLELAPGIPRSLDVLPHPHIGLSTLTYLYSGALTHRDSLGCQQEIRPGEVNWMTAGSGITHSERLEYARQNGALLHGIQSWVALPREFEEIQPSFHHLQGSEQLPQFTAKGLTGRLIAGSLAGLSAKVPVYSPLFYVHLDMSSNSSYTLPAEYSERAVYMAEGAVTVDGHKLMAGHMQVIDHARPIKIFAHSPGTVMLLGGEPVGERFISWNFVSSSKERIEQASEDWRQQRMRLPVGDEQEYVPLP